MARVIHIAVNLLLIVAVTMQPGLAYGLQGDCSTEATTGFTCQGCGCCKVQSETAKCPCCSGEASNDEGGCCSHGQKHKDQVATFVDDPFAGMELEKGPAPERSAPEQRVSEESKQPCGENVQPECARVASACHCVTAPKPFDAPAPRSPATELRDAMTAGVAFCGDATLAERPPLAAAFDVAHRPIVPHYSQIAFCVWRL